MKKMPVPLKERTLVDRIKEIRAKCSQEDRNIMTLDELAIEYGTDKSSKDHNYTEIYEQMFSGIREEPLKILEIGIAGGASIRMWRDYFPNAEIHGIDISVDEYRKAILEDPESNLPSLPSRTHFHIGDQGDKDFLDTIGIDFDIVIDDGSHRVADQIFTFNHLWPNTRLVYIVEDVYSSYLARYGGGYRRSGTAIEFFKDLVDDVNADVYKSTAKSKLIHRSAMQVAMIQFYPCLVCVYKRK